MKIVTTRITRGLAAAMLALLLPSAAPVGGPDTFDFGNTTWTFDGATVKSGGHANGIGTVKDSTTATLQVHLDVNGTWTLKEGALVVTGGTWSVTGPTSKTINLTVDGQGQQELQDWEEGLLQNGFSEKFLLNTSVTLDEMKSGKLKMKIHLHAKTQTATAKLSGGFKFTGTTNRSDVSDAPTKAHYNVKGESEGIPLSDILQ